MKKILVIDDHRDSREAIKETLSKESYEVIEASSGAEGAEIIKSGEMFHLIITDLVMPGTPRIEGMEILKTAKKELPPCEVIMLTGHGTIENAVEAMKAGAYDYLNKPIDIKRLREVVKKALEKQEILAENQNLHERIAEQYGYSEIIGTSEKMKEIFSKIAKVSPTKATVLIYGESGTGKELVANAIYYNSPRVGKPFIKCNCAALSESLLESELFGHEKGSFTGAISKKIGQFELADTGTLLLDEIGEMSLTVQAKILRIIEQREFMRVGGTKNINVDVRLLFATNKNLEEEVKKGNFREDLYFRINVLTIRILPLRERKEDIIHLTKSFIDRFNQENKRNITGIDQDALSLFMNYDWPGNVRELKNTIESIVITKNGDGNITKNDLPELLQTIKPANKDYLDQVVGMKMDDIEKELIRRTLNNVNGNKTKASEILGISLRTFYRKLKEYGLE
ncbi:MAG: sigma-54-dependent Fis family transcriptional regulator [Candidatus Firestonebacteria bacterium]|nr:sigma-54-dependent Fis family transcriptional regulator [Candidatus Firestonebacteria bacterium]